MKHKMVKRAVLFLGSFLVIYCFNFFIPRMMPGDPFTYTSSVTGEDSAGMSEEQIEKMKAYYGMDKPLGTQFVESIQKNLKGDLGQSIYYKKSVSSVLVERMPWTLYIMLTSLLLSLIISTGLALWGTRRRRVDSVCYAIFSATSEIPSFLVGTLLLFFVAAQVGWIPLSGNITAFADFDNWCAMMGDIFVHSLLPILSMVLVTLPQFYFTARASFLNISHRPYITNAHAKGLKERRIRIHYILRNGISPIVARFFLSIGSAVGGTILVENVFAYPGLGKVLREAVMYRDYVMIQGVFLISTILVLVSLLIADVLNGLTDRGLTK